MQCTCGAFLSEKKSTIILMKLHDVDLVLSDITLLVSDNTKRGVNGVHTRAKLKQKREGLVGLKVS